MEEALIRNLESLSISDSILLKQCNSELIRLYTFRNWNAKVFVIRLAETGFFYLGEGDKVQCYFCHVEKENWAPGDKPSLVHQKLNANCPLLSNSVQTNNIPIYSNLVEEPLPAYFSKIIHLLSERHVERDRDLIPESPGDRPVMSHISDSSPGSMNLPRSRSRDSSIGSTGSQENRGGRGNSQEGGSLEQPPQRFSLGLSGPQAATPSLPQTLSGGIPSSQNEATPSQPLPLEGDPSFLRYERNRLETFRNFPASAHVLPRDLASSGFIYTGTGDRVQCVFCRGILRDWDVGEKPHIEHKNKFPRCPFILGVDVGNVRMTPAQPAQRVNIAGNLNNSPLGNMEALGINTDRPRHGNYAVESTRLTSFNNWPQYKHQTPPQLAAAGFFYAGFGDNVKCFYCDGGLRNWEPGDEPWVEHARWFPRCSFVRTVKGDQFIRNVQERFNRPLSTSGHQVEAREIRARMELPMVRAVLETGVDRNSVMQVIERRLRETGDDYPSAEALLNAVLTLEEEPEVLNVASQEPVLPEYSHTPPRAPTPSNASQSSAKSEEPSSSTGGGSKDLVEENRLLREQKTCKICLDAEVGMVFLPCGHLCCCVMCAPAVRQCPICRAEIRGTVRTFIP
ncbi:baculoviral IAP repeat-containing protein 7-like isoform X1 [Saccostrea echinata]|uniref:baculoviral IAP repeat-containing protein 7-like isoform X1 n=1 Tax=Saccostrea echinata TaxID=191078 RepID=UPI002A819BD6|nr:baculoviral IAP repeat-containing protein 7-like isoform X1 [Saccostrea echinata]